MMVKWLEIELQQKPKNVTVAEHKNNYNCMIDFKYLSVSDWHLSAG